MSHKINPNYTKLLDDSYYREYISSLKKIRDDRADEIIKYGSKLGTKKKEFETSCISELDDQYYTTLANLDYLRSVIPLSPTNVEAFDKAFIEAVRTSTHPIWQIPNPNKKFKWISQKFFNNQSKSSFLLDPGLIKCRFELEKKFNENDTSTIDAYVKVGLKNINNDNYLIAMCDKLRQSKEKRFYAPNRKINELQKIFLREFNRVANNYDYLSLFDVELRNKQFLKFCDEVKDKKVLLLLLLFVKPFEFSEAVSRIVSIAINKVLSEDPYFNKLHLVTNYLEEVITILVNGIRVGQLHKIYDIFFEHNITLTRKDKYYLRQVCKSRVWKRRLTEENADFDRILANVKMIIPISIKHIKEINDSNAGSMSSLRHASGVLDKPLAFGNEEDFDNYRAWLLKVLYFSGMTDKSLSEMAEYFQTKYKNKKLSLSEFFKALKSYVGLDKESFEKFIVQSFLAYVKALVCYSAMIPTIMVVCKMQQKTMIATPFSFYKDLKHFKIRGFESNTYQELYSHLVKKERIPYFTVYDAALKRVCLYKIDKLFVNKNVLVKTYNENVKEIKKMPTFTCELPMELNGNII